MADCQAERRDPGGWGGYVDPIPASEDRGDFGPTDSCEHAAMVRTMGRFTTDRS